MTVPLGDATVEWLGYATVRVEAGDGTIVYVDPGRYGVLTGEWTPDTPGVGHPAPVDYRAADGDLVVVTHDHHYDPDGIERVAADDATVLVYEAVDAAGIDRDVRPVADLPYDVVRVDDEADGVFADVVLDTVPAYNEPGGPHAREDGTPFHPEGFGCGVRFAAGDRTYFWPGDTDVLEGHAALDVDVFLPPIGGSFTMDRSAAADLAARLEPELVVPIHYNTFAALETDARAFAADVAESGVPVALDER